MTDLDRLTSLLDEFGIKYIRYVSEGDTLIIVEQENNLGKVRGYSGFYTKFVFFQSGGFQEMGAYE